MVTSLQKRLSALKKEQEQVKADFKMIETRWEKAADIEAKISSLRLSPGYLGAGGSDKLRKVSEGRIRAAEAILKQIEALKSDPQTLEDSWIEILQYQVTWVI